MVWLETGTVTGWDAHSYTDFDVLDEAPVGITISDPSATENQFVYANGRFLALTGFERETLLGQPYRFLAGPATDDETLEQVERAIEAGESMRTELKTYRADGTAFWNQSRLMPFPADDGERCLIVHDDITGKRRTSRALDALTRFATDIQQASTVTEACELAAQTAFDTLPTAYCTVAMRNGEWLVPRGAAGDVPQAGSQRRQLDSGVAGDALRRGESRRIGDRSELIPDTETSRSGLVVPIGEYGVLEAVAVDADAFDDSDVTIAERLGADTAVAIERLNRERRTEWLEAFADAVTSDIETPLSVLDESLASARATGDEAQFERARRALEQLYDHVESLPEAPGPGDRTDEVVDLFALTKSCWEQLATDDVDLSIQTDHCVRADEDRLARLLTNLFRNAIEHGDAWQLTLGELSDGTGFYVQDDGSGIPESERDGIFERGFGLTLCKQIVRDHGWEISVTDSKDGGTRFEIAGVETENDRRR